MARANLLLQVFCCAGLAGCADHPASRPFAQFRTYAPANEAVAQFPKSMGGGEAYQDTGGAVVALDSTPALNDTGSEQSPDYPAGEEKPIVGRRSQVIMPNGGEGIVQSVNSLP